MSAAVVPIPIPAIVPYRNAKGLCCIVFTYDDAYEAFMHIHDFPILCIDVPRSKYCTSCADAHEFYFGQSGSPEHEKAGNA